MLDNHPLIRDTLTRVDEVRTHVMRLLPYWVAGAITAIVATAYAQLFFYIEDAALHIYQSIGYWFLLFSPACFVGSWLLVEKLEPSAAGSGIPQLRFAIEMGLEKKNHLIDRVLGFRVILVKIVSSMLGLLGGGAIGREGPTLQISGSIFHLVDKRWPQVDAKGRQGFILAGAASGLASAFNTPLGGIVYVIEELAKSHLTHFRAGVLHSVIVAGIISQMFMGSYLYFGYPKVGAFHFTMVFECILLALIAGAVVAGFGNLAKSVVVFRASLKNFRQRFIFTSLVGFVFALICVFISEKTLGPGRSLLDLLLFKEHMAQVSDVFSRFFGTLLTYANGGAGGIFAPTLSLGGSSASLIGGWIQFQYGPLAVLVGMTAGLSALTHSPLTSFILILEMTDRHSAIFPLMIASVIGHGISRMISRQSFYEFVLERLIGSVKKEEEVSDGRTT